MTSCGCLTINPPPQAAMQRREFHGQRNHQSSSSSPTTEAREITDEGVESEETASSRRRSPCSSESTMSSSISSCTSSSESRGQGTQQEQHARQEQQQQRQQPFQKRKAIRDGEITGTSSIPTTAIVRRRPLHETLGQDNDDNFEVALSWHRNKRILLGRLMETAPHGKLSMVSIHTCDKHQLMMTVRRVQTIHGKIF